MPKAININKKIWKIAPGEGHEYFEPWKNAKHIAMGWWFRKPRIKTGDSKEKIKEKYLEYQGSIRKKNRWRTKAGFAASQLSMFYNDLNEGDTVVVYGKNKEWMLGRVKNGKVHDEKYVEGDYSRRRDVTWYPTENLKRPPNLFKGYNIRPTIVPLDKPRTKTKLMRVLQHWLKVREVRKTSKTKPRTSQVVNEPQVKPDEIASFKRLEATEGERYKKEATFRTRNAKLILEKKKISDGKCEVCNMKFEERYGKIGRGYRVVHHKKAIGSRKVAAPTTLKDLAVVCANCHAMLHRTEPPMTLKQLRNRMK